jgi:hypothetical protein
MSVLLKAIETTGHVDDRYHITLDQPLFEMEGGKVRVIVLLADEADEVSEAAWLAAAAQNPAFQFLRDQEEDIYSLADGTPFHA